MSVDLEEIITELVVNGGDAKSKAIMAIRQAKSGNFGKAQDFINECNVALNNAHAFQSELLTKEAQGAGVNISLVMIHGQDHLMNAITTRDLAIEMIELYRTLENK